MSDGADMNTRITAAETGAAATRNRVTTKAKVKQTQGYRTGQMGLTKSHKPI